jgi:hypothetical protein
MERQITMKRFAQGVALIAVACLINMLILALLGSFRSRTIAQPATSCVAGDVNGDLKLDISDPIYLLRHLFGDGSPPIICAQTMQQNCSPPFFRPEDFGTPGVGTDDAPLIQKAIKEAESSGGGIVLLSGRSYAIRSPLTLAGGGVILAGVGWGAGKLFPGSWLHVERPDISAIKIQGDLRNSCILRDFAIRYDQPEGAPGWRPLESPYSVDINAVDDVLIQNILLFNVSRGIRGIRTGRLHIDKLFGQPLIVGIELAHIFDVPRINNVHFWPFWSQHESIYEFTTTTAVGIRSARCDNPHFSNLFFFKYLRGIYFTTSDDGPVDENGPTNKFRISQIDCDYCRDAVYIDGSNTTGQITNITTQGTDMPGSTGLFVNAQGAKIQIANLRINDAGHNGVRVKGGVGTFVGIENCWIDVWDKSNEGFPAIEAVDPGTTIYIGRSRWFCNGGNGGKSPQWGGQGQVILDDPQPLERCPSE